MTNADSLEKKAATTSRCGKTIDARGMTVALLVSRFNDRVTDRLLEGAESFLDEHGCTTVHRPVFRVPGCWELPLAADRLGATGSCDAIIALGCLIRGETSHFDVLATSVARGLQQVGLAHKIPVVFGVLTTDTAKQALARSGGDHGNKGRETALAAIDMVHLYRRMT